jgi:hypothetical protein
MQNLTLTMSVCLSEIMLQILQLMEETRTIVMESQRIIDMLKVSGLDSGIDDVTTDDSVLQLIKRPLENAETAE